MSRTAPTRKTPTQFLYSASESMVLRSGKSINGINNSKLNRDAMMLTNGDTSADTPQYGYCRTCFLIFGLFDFIEKYHKELRGDETTIHGGKTQWIPLYNVIRVKLENFIDCIDRGVCRCKCEEQDRLLDMTLSNNIHRMDTMAMIGNYEEMADYTGYGREREKYRIYHRNFFIVEEFEIDDGHGEFFSDYTITRDFHMTRHELLHWLEYFKKPHQSVIDATRTALSAYKKAYIGTDCIEEIIKFL